MKVSKRGFRYYELLIKPLLNLQTSAEIFNVIMMRFVIKKQKNFITPITSILMFWLHTPSVPRLAFLF
jgi:hypothetical protein